MTRAIIQELCCFSCLSPPSPSILVIARRNPLAWSSWSKQTSWLVIAGLGHRHRVAASTGGFCAERQTGTYVPSHMENGVLVPGHFE